MHNKVIKAKLLCYVVLIPLKYRTIRRKLKKDIDGIFIDFFPPYKRQQRKIG